MARTKIHINEASRDELAEIRGIGPATADTLVKLRKERGGFKSVDELSDVPGIGAQTLESIRTHVTVSRNGGSESRKAAEAATKSAETAAKAGEAGAKTATSNGTAAANKMAEMGRSEVKMARDTMASQAETVRRSVETGSAKTKELVEETAGMQQDVIGAVREAQEAWVGLVQEQMAANMQVARRLVECRTPQDFASLQAEYLRGSMERFVQGSARVTAPAAHIAGTWWSPERWQHLAARR
jgi:competence protein ComEA